MERSSSLLRWEETISSPTSSQSVCVGLCVNRRLCVCVCEVQPVCRDCVARVVDVQLWVWFWSFQFSCEWHISTRPDLILSEILWCVSWFLVSASVFRVTASGSPGQRSSQTPSKPVLQIVWWISSTHTNSLIQSLIHVNISKVYVLKLCNNTCLFYKTELTKMLP